MDKKQILIIVIVGIVVVALTIGLMFLISKNGINLNTTKNDKSNIKTNNNELTVGSYTIKYGKYKGFEEEYNFDSDSIDKKELTIEITNTMIITGDNKVTYSVEGNKIITSNGLQYEVIANNKISLLAGGGVEFNYEG